MYEMKENKRWEATGGASVRERSELNYGWKNMCWAWRRQKFKLNKGGKLDWSEIPQLDLIACVVTCLGWAEVLKLIGSILKWSTNSSHSWSGEIKLYVIETNTHNKLAFAENEKWFSRGQGIFFVFLYEGGVMKSSFKRCASFLTRQFESITILYSATSNCISLKVKLQQDHGIKGCVKVVLRVIRESIKRHRICEPVTQSVWQPETETWLQNSRLKRPMTGGRALVNDLKAT